ncbi:hypothetical protein PM082_008252 [Marasmius tenuissimus]|nr:hypothetical protein PM082_008252 [Marasmius tenuissimus]
MYPAPIRMFCTWLVVRPSEPEIRSLTEGPQEVVLSNGQQQTLSISLEGESKRELTGWELNITAWAPPEDLSQVDPILVPEPTIDLSQGLVPWAQLDGQVNTSRVGTYMQTIFEWAHGKISSVDFQLTLALWCIRWGRS